MTIEQDENILLDEDLYPTEATDKRSLLTEGVAPKKKMKEEEEESDEEELEEESDEEDEDDDKESDDDEEECDESKKMKKEDVTPVDFSDDVSALMEGEDTLSESFKEKASLIFETAFNRKVEEIRVQLQEEKDAQVADEVNEQMDATIDVMSESIDKYLTHIADEWLKENRIAVETALRTEIAENFISGLKTLFTEHYIEVPEDKVDLVEELSTRVDTLKDRLNQTQERNLELAEQIRDFRKKEIIEGLCEDLTLSESERLREFASDVEFLNEDSFIEKIEILKKSYFGKKSAPKSRIDEEVENHLGVNIDESVDGEIAPKNTKMNRYVETLTASIPSRFLNHR